MKALNAKILAACIMMLAIMLPVTSHAITCGGLSDCYGDRPSWETAVGSFADVDISYIPDGSPLPANTAVALPAGADAASVKFDVDLTRYQVPDTWLTWSGGQEPAVLASGSDVIVKGTFSDPVGAFGVEMEPSPFAEFAMMLKLSDGSVYSQPVNGLAGAKFFGWVSGIGITYMEMSCVTGCDGDGFAFGRMVTETGTGVPEPSTLLFLGFGLAGLGFWRMRKNRV